MLKELQQSLKKEVPKARNIIKQIFGEDIILHRTINGHLEAEVSANAMEMFGFPTNARIGLVAGTGDSTYSQSRGIYLHAQSGTSAAPDLGKSGTEIEVNVGELLPKSGNRHSI